MFDGIDDQITYTVPASGLDVNADCTLLIVARIMVAADNTWLSFIETETSGAAASAALVRQQLVATLGSVGYSSGPTLGNGGTAITDSDSWMLIAATKAAGSSTPRLHSSLLAGPTHRHNNGGGAFAAPASIASGTLRIGGNDDFANIRVAAAAIFDKVLSDAEIEGIATAKTTQSIYNLTPVWLVDDNDAFLADYMGKSGNGSKTGTADDADDPAGWVYGIAAAAAGPTAVPSFADTRRFAWAPIPDAKMFGSLRASQLGALRPMRATGPHPAGGFERTLYTRLHAQYGVEVPVAPAAISGVATVSGAVVRLRALTAAASGVATVSSSVVRTRARTASSAGVATVAATVVRVRTRSASASGVATVSAALVRIRALTATATGVATVSSALVRTRVVAAAATGVAAVSASIVRTRRLVATSSGVATVSTSIVRARPLAVAATGVATVSAALTRHRSLVATSNGVSAVSAALVRTRALTASAGGVATVAGATVRTRPVAATASGAASVAANLVRTRALTISAAGSSTVTGGLGSDKPVAAAINAGATVAAALNRDRAIAATAEGTTTVAGTVTTPPAVPPDQPPVFHQPVFLPPVRQIREVQLWPAPIHGKATVTCQLHVEPPWYDIDQEFAELLALALLVPA